jgi:hypothetical protein
MTPALEKIYVATARLNFTQYRLNPTEAKHVRQVLSLTAHLSFLEGFPLRELHR